MKNLFDSISTVTWLAMDMCWMYDFHFFSIFFMILTIVGVITCTTLSEDYSKKYIIVHSANISWVMMNSMWMLGDRYNFAGIEILKILFTFTSVASVLIVAYFDISILRSIRKFNK